MIKEITVVGDIQVIPGKGLAVSGGLINYDVDCRILVGKKIHIRNRDGSEYTVPVIDYSESLSIIGRKNVFFLLPFEFADLIKPHALLYL